MALPLLALLPLVGAGLGLAGNIYSTERQISSSKRMQDDAQDFNAAQAELAYDRQVEFFEKYQSPYAMIESAKKAGVNPFSIGASVGSGSAISPASASSGVGSVGSLPNIGAFFADVMSRVAEIKNARKLTDSEVNLKDAQAEEIRTRIPWIDRLNSINYDKLASDIKLNEQKVNESIQTVKESVSRITVNDSTIEVNGSKISLNASQENLNAVKSFVESLNANKLAILMPYVESAEKSRIALDQASTESARASAAKSYTDASFALLKQSVEQGLIDKGYYDALVEKSEFEAKQGKRNYKWTPIQNVVHDISLIAVGVGSVLGGVGKLN